MLGAGMEGIASALEGSAKPARTEAARAPRKHARTKHIPDRANGEQERRHEAARAPTGRDEKCR